MSPTARAELGLPAHTDSHVDMHVAWVCVLAAGVTAAALWGQHVARSERQVCAQQLDDGRRLITYHLGMKGQERCVYEAPRPAATTKRKGP